ncbi:stress-responsive transcription factor hsf1 [Nowakowskiella sp. JEL0407]|nr:stress-responsive transcription factor hsf1 [Nowakowskiella sp. JEL0407]
MGPRKRKSDGKPAVSESSTQITQDVIAPIPEPVLSNVSVSPTVISPDSPQNSLPFNPDFMAAMLPLLNSFQTSSLALNNNQLIPAPTTSAKSVAFPSRGALNSSGKNVPAFLNKLYKYGFRKIPHLNQGVLHSDPSSEIWEFENPYFQKGKPELLLFVQRKKKEVPADTNNTDVAASSNVALPSVLANITSMDLQRIFQELASIKQNQLNISHDLKRIQEENQVLWTDAADVRERYRRQQATIDKILRFLASVFSPKKGTLAPKKKRLQIEEAGFEELNEENEADDADAASKAGNSAPASVNHGESTNAKSINSLTEKVASLDEDIDLLQDELEGLSSSLGFDHYLDDLDTNTNGASATTAELQNLFSTAAVSNPIPDPILATSKLEEDSNSATHNIPINDFLVPPLIPNPTVTINPLTQPLSTTDILTVLNQYPALAESLLQSAAGIPNLNGLDPSLLALYLSTLKPINYTPLITNPTTAPLQNATTPPVVASSSSDDYFRSLSVSTPPSQIIDATVPASHDPNDSHDKLLDELLLTSHTNDAFANPFLDIEKLVSDSTDGLGLGVGEDGDAGVLLRNQKGKKKAKKI